MVTTIPVQRWMRHLRELAYDIKDWIDGLLVHSWGWFKLKWCSSHLTPIQTFRDQIRQMNEIAASYGVDLDELDPTEDLEEYKPWELHPKDRGEEKPCLFGLRGPKSKLLKHLLDHEQRLKVTCILGQADHSCKGCISETAKPVPLQSFGSVLAGTHPLMQLSWISPAS
jgi:hypothetical protein